PEITRVSGRSKIKRKFTLNTCLCSLELDGSMHNVLKCNQTGCETQWYHLMCVELEQKPRNWICAACEASGQ
ncbi:hypothetical protein BYT27DRAFT_7014338, partial [Phlegmacium glaucopus]